MTCSLLFCRRGLSKQPTFSHRTHEIKLLATVFVSAVCVEHALKLLFGAVFAALQDLVVLFRVALVIASIPVVSE